MIFSKNPCSSPCKIFCRRKWHYGKSYFTLPVLIIAITLLVFSSCKKGSSTLIIEPTKGIVTEKGGLSKAEWGVSSTAVIGNKVVMGSGSKSNSILIIDTENDTDSKSKKE